MRSPKLDSLLPVSTERLAYTVNPPLHETRRRKIPYGTNRQKSKILPRTLHRLHLVRHTRDRTLSIVVIFFLLRVLLQFIGVTFLHFNSKFLLYTIRVPVSQLLNVTTLTLSPKGYLGGRRVLGRNGHPCLRVSTTRYYTTTNLSMSQDKLKSQTRDGA